MRVLCLGFSVTDPKGYVAELAKLLPEHDVVAVGIGGIDIQPLPPIYDEIVEQHGTFDLVLLEIFTSIFAKVQPVSANATVDIFYDLLTRIQATNARVAFLRLYRDDVDQRDSGFDLIAEAIAARHGLPLIDFAHDTIERLGLDYCRSLHWDSVHLKPEGARAVAAYASNFIVPASISMQTRVPPPKLRRCKVSPSPAGSITRAGYTCHYGEIGAGSELRIKLPAGKVYGISFVTGPEAGCLMLTSGTARIEIQCFDQHSYYPHFVFRRLSASLADELVVKQLQDLPSVPLLKGEPNTGPRIGRLIAIYVEEEVKRSGAA